MSNVSEEKNNEIQKAFPEKVKNMVGVIRENLQSHGGNIELVGIGPDNAVKLRFQCEGDCSKAQEVLETGVKELMKQRIPEVTEVVTVD